jgi:lantibiotic modifying enzyme
MEKEKTELLLRIANHWILHASFNSGLGLFNGKMGCAVFFFHYARYTGNDCYEYFAGELLNEIYEDIHADTSVRFSSGITGIAWGVTYLIYAGFVEGNPGEILTDIDRKIMEKDLRRISDYSLESGLEGIAWYALSRLYSKENKPFDANWLSDLQQACNRIEKEKRPKGILSFSDHIAGKRIENPFFGIIEKLTETSGNKPDNALSWQKGLSIIVS